MSDRYKNRCQIFTPEQIEALRKSGVILHDVLRHAASLVRPGIATIELDRAAETFIRDHGGIPAFKGYHGFPASLCVSANDVCVHGIPGTWKLREGDIVGLDCGVFFQNLCTDACITVPVGAISSRAQTLVSATEEALASGIAKVRAGAKTGDISFAIHQKLRRHGFDAMRQLTGHGLGDDLHQFPDIPNFGEAGSGHLLPANTIIAIEPISTMGSVEIREDSDHWTLRTMDGSLSAHFEHTVLVTEKGCEILT